MLGSISSAVLICKIFNLPDPRTVGSRNPGATNVFRISNKYIASLVLFIDVLKGTIPVWGAYFLEIEPIYLGVVAIAACLGHMYPVFFEFKGGKAVATALGALLPIGLDLGGLLIVTWISVAITTKYSSIASLVTLVLTPFYIWLLKPIYLYPVMMLCLLIMFRHKDNIVRLLQGNESKISAKK